MAVNDIILEDSFGQPGQAHVSEPEFTLEGDGGASLYHVEFDGHSIGLVHGDGWGNVHIQAPHLDDGDHEVTWQEVEPVANLHNGSYPFKVDTKAPTHPAITSISRRAPGVNLWDVYGHTANHQPFPVHIVDHKIGVLIGGAQADADGNFFAAVVPWNPTHRVHAVTLDLAGNPSKPSPAKSLPKT